MYGRLKSVLKGSREEKRKADYKEKKLQSEIFSGLDEKSHQWMDANIDPKKVGAIISMQEQMVETRAWKKLRGLLVNTEECRLCKQRRETVHHLLSGCTSLAGTEYLRRHNNCLMVLAVEWCKMNGLLKEDASCFKVKWTKGTVLENRNMKMSWDFEFNLRKTTSARRPDLILEDKIDRRIWIVDMACPSEGNIAEKRQEKLQKYQQLAYEIRERRHGYKVEIVPVVIGCFGGGMVEVERQVNKIVLDMDKVRNICKTMQKTLLYESESVLRKVLSGLIQEE